MATGGRQVTGTARLLLGGTWDSLETRLGLRGMLLSRDTSRTSWHVAVSRHVSDLVALGSVVRHVSGLLAGGDTSQATWHVSQSRASEHVDQFRDETCLDSRGTSASVET